MHVGHAMQSNATTLDRYGDIYAIEHKYKFHEKEMQPYTRMNNFNLKSQNDRADLFANKRTQIIDLL